VLAAIALPLAVLVLAALAGNMIQHRLVWSADSLKPKFSKISPLAGLKRLFSSQALANFAKGLIKLAVIGSVMVALLWPQRHRLEGLVSTDILGTLLLTCSLSLELLAVVGCDHVSGRRCRLPVPVPAVVRAPEDVAPRDERGVQATEGDPLVKGKIRQLRQARMRKRMMAAVPKASVIITKPTDYAIAFRPRAARRRRDRPGNPARALQGGRRNHRLRRENCSGPQAGWGDESFSFVIPGPAGCRNPESRYELGVCIWIPCSPLRSAPE
jgi:flagellar biosynthetic protein FlhB